MRSTKNGFLECFFVYVRVCVCVFVWFGCLFGVFTFRERHRFHLTHFPRPSGYSSRIRNNAFPIFFQYSAACAACGIERESKLFHAFASTKVTENRYLGTSCLLALLVNNLRCAEHANKWERDCDISIRLTWHPLDTPDAVSWVSNKISEGFKCRVVSWKDVKYSDTSALSAEIHLNFHNILITNEVWYRIQSTHMEINKYQFYFGKKLYFHRAK